MMKSNQRQILVTGADGFIGSHLVEALCEEGCRVRALSYYNSFNNWGWLEEARQHHDFEVVSGDIRDPYFCRQIVGGVDLIFHLAALIAIPYSYVAPDSYIDTNVKGTLNICQAARDGGKIRMIHTSTSEVYGTAQYVPIDEKHPKQPQSPYSASKIAADAVVLSFFHAFDLPVTIARPFNTYGPRQSARAVIPTIITQIASGVEVIRLGDVSPTRDFNFVKDTCRGFLAIAECDATIGREVNIASNQEISIGETLELIKNIMGAKVHFVAEEQRVRPKDSEVFRLWGDNTLIRTLTGHVPAYTLEEGLRETCQWFSDANCLKKYKPTIYNV
jgi:NAD dependent epimerase/dehydratase